MSEKRITTRSEESTGWKESDVENYLTKQVGKIGVLSMKWVCPGHNGVPDRLLIGTRSNIYFVEVKRPKGGRVRPLQKLWQEELGRRGFVSVIVKNREEVDALVERIRKDEEKENED